MNCNKSLRQVIAPPSIISAGIYADDEAASAAGVAYQGWYTNTNGQLVQLNRRVMHYITAVGSSSFSKGSLYNPAANNNHFYGESVLEHFRKQTGLQVQYVRDINANANPVSGQYHFAVPSTTLVQHLAAGGVFDRALKAAVDLKALGKTLVILLQCGRNDTGNAEAAATTVANVESAINRAENLGVADQLILMTDQPRLYNTAGPDERTILPIRLAKNQGIRDLGVEYNIPVLDVAAIYEDPANLGYADATVVDSTRPGHWEEAPAWRIGLLLYQLASTRYIYGPKFQLGSLLGHASVINSNALLTGTGGSGGRPTGISAGNNGSTTAEWTTFPYDDSSGRFWLRSMINANGSNGNHQLSINSVTNGVVAGDTYIAACEIRFPYQSSLTLGSITSAFGIGSTFLQVRRDTTFVGGGDGQPVVGLNTPPTVVDYTNKVLTLYSMPWVATAGVANLSWLLQTSGSGMFDVSTPMIIRNPQNIAGFPYAYESIYP